MMSGRTFLFVAAPALSLALLNGSPASARTVCRPDGCCFNTSGEPIPDQPRHCYRHWRHHERYYEEAPPSPPYDYQPGPRQYDDGGGPQ